MTPLADGFCFGEGPRWFEGMLWFSDMLGEALHTVTLCGSGTTLPLPGHAPSGLGFRPDGTLLIVSTEAKQVLAYDGDHVTLVADLSGLAPAALGDMVVDEAGRAWDGKLALIELANGEAAPTYFAGTGNFYAITRYNWSSYYAMAVIELGEAIRRQRR